MRGRPPTPTALKVLKGTDQPSRLRADEMAPTKLTDVPLAPSYLTERGKEEWYTTCSELSALGMLHKVDLSLLAAYCNEMSTYWEAEELLRTRGRVMTIKNPDGSTKYMQQVPHVSIARNALKMALTLASQFGFTPSARTRISPAKKDKPSADPWQDL